MFRSSPESKAKWYLPATAVGVLALSACESPASVDAASETTATTEVPSTTAQAAANMLVFDALGGGSNVIEVYPGTSDADADKQSNAKYYSGNEVPAICKEDGRTVSSVVADGEEDRTSDQWVRIQGASTEAEYATAVYIENPDELLSRLPNC